MAGPGDMPSMNAITVSPVSSEAATVPPKVTAKPPANSSALPRTEKREASRVFR